MMTNNGKNSKMNKGVVTFLDVLGWKGVYDRKENAIDTLKQLIADITTWSDKRTRGSNLEIKIKSISDTIAFFTECNDTNMNAAIEIHGELCRQIIPESIRKEIPVRGATTFGDFEISDNIFVGKAVDEAASWHEQSDWIGVHLTPSAEFAFKTDGKSTAWIKYPPPNKVRLDWKPRCVDWTKDDSGKPLDIEELKERFRNMGPITPEIASKFTNTLEFYHKINTDK